MEINTEGPTVSISEEDQAMHLVEIEVAVAPSAVFNEVEVAGEIELEFDGEHSQQSLLKPSNELKQTECVQSNNINNSVYDDDGLTCPICLDTWTNYGDHRVCSLKCGHLFGLKCIERWFTQKQNTCPTCKKKALKTHIRNIYAQRLIAIDTSEYESVKKNLEEISHKNTQLKIELTRSACHELLLSQQIDSLKKEISTLRAKLDVKEILSQPSNEHCKSVRLYKDKSLEICSYSGCRVLDYCTQQELILASIKSSNPLFPGFGVRKINISTYKPTTFISLHSKSIRDLSIHSRNPWLLSVSLDKTIKIVDILTNNTTCTYTQGEVPLWACCWDVDNLNAFYVGSQQGTVSKFDMRYMYGPVSIFEAPADMSPVVSLAPLCSGDFITRSGVIICKLNSVWVFENETDSRFTLPVEGPFSSMRYQNNTNQLLLSTRPNSNQPNSGQLLCTLTKSSENNLSCSIIHNLLGDPVQKYLSRSCFVEVGSDRYIAAHQECSKSIFLWSISTGHKVSSIATHEPVLDLCNFSAGYNNFLVSLTEKKVEFFKFT